MKFINTKIPELLQASVHYDIVIKDKNQAKMTTISEVTADENCQHIKFSKSPPNLHRGKSRIVGTQSHER